MTSMVLVIITFASIRTIEIQVIVDFALPLSRAMPGCLNYVDLIFNVRK